MFVDKKKYKKDVEWLKENVPKNKIYDFANQMIEHFNIVDGDTRNLSCDDLSDRFLILEVIRDNMSWLNQHRNEYKPVKLDLTLHG